MSQTNTPSTADLHSMASHVYDTSATLGEGWESEGNKSIGQAQLLATQWLWIYNNERPNIAINDVPSRYLLKVA